MLMCPNVATSATSGPHWPPYSTGISNAPPFAAVTGLFTARSRLARTSRMSAMSGSKYTATERYVATTSRTPAITSSRTAAAMAMARALTPSSITASSWSNSAESPASLIVGSVMERPKQFPMDAAKTAVGHDHDDVALPMFADDRGDDLVVLGDVPRLFPGRPDVGD